MEENFWLIDAPASDEFYYSTDGQCIDEAKLNYLVEDANGLQHFVFAAYLEPSRVLQKGLT